MKKKYAAFCGGLAVLASVAVGVEVGEKPNTPKLPGVEYVVHDGTRPQPRKVKSGGAVSIAAPGDAKVLFDGKNIEAWTGGDWKVKDGILVANHKGLKTKEAFGDCQLHVEWRVPAGRKTHGQHGGNSGVFLMGRYEIQVQESFKNKTYPDGQAGGMYGQFPPLANASAPQGEWQSYDILFKAPRYEGEKCVSPATVTVMHNGVVIHLNQPFYGPTKHKQLTNYPPKHPKKAPLLLQWHGDPIEYRNIWIREFGKYDQQ